MKKTGERIKTIYSFSLALQKAMKEQQQLSDQWLKMIYRVDDELKILVDPKVKL